MFSLSLRDHSPVSIRTGARAAEQDPAPTQRSLLCLVLPAPRLPRRVRGAGAGGFGSILLHVSAVVAVVAVSAALPPSPATQSGSSDRQLSQAPRLVFFQIPGPGGGGGGGGARQATPPSRAQAVGSDRLTMQIARPAVTSDQRDDAIIPPQQAVLDATPLASGTTVLTGLPDASPALPFSQGPGVGGGVGEGRGTGIGSGSGPGVGPGSGGGFGGGAYLVGPGVTAPTLLTQVKPKYTTEALRLKIQGTVVLEVVVGRDGTPTAIRVTRSLDAGLDREAIAALGEWRFTPGRIGTTPVDVLVTVFLDFRII